MRRYLPLRRLHFNRQKPSILENAENVGNAGGVAGDVRVPAPDKDSRRIVLPAENALVAEVVEDLLLDMLFEDGSMFSCSPLPRGKGRKLSRLGGKERFKSMLNFFQCYINFSFTKSVTGDNKTVFYFHYFHPSFAAC